MAGSELDGLDGAQADLFEGAVWVLTPGSDSDDAVFAQVASVVASFGAEVVALGPERHDQLVAVVSHVPHLTAATLMGLASERAEEHAALLRLAAGGFRDMTRVASGRPGDLARHLRREPHGDRRACSTSSSMAWRRCATSSVPTTATRSTPVSPRPVMPAPTCPTRVVHPDELSEVRIPIPDRAGAAAEVFTLAAELSVNIASFEVVHVAESTRGVAVVLVDRAMVELFRGGLLARGFRPAVQPLS